MNPISPSIPPGLADRSGRRISYLRLSVTDRCDFRCSYCMPVDARFAPPASTMTLEENFRLVRAFAALGVRKLRLTGGEPLVRRGLASLISRVAALPEQLDVVMTTNGSQLAKHAASLRAAGLSRLNVSLDSLDPARFRRITHSGDVSKVRDGLQAAKDAGFERIKLNVVAMRGVNDDEILALVEYAMREEFNISFIEEMPFGDARRARADSFMSSQEVRSLVNAALPLLPTTETTGGPARYYRIAGSETRVGFISPRTHDFCDTCNRVRVTATGDLYTCLASAGSQPLLPLLRATDYEESRVRQAIVEALRTKPDGHDFGDQLDYRPIRFMSQTGG